MDVLVIGQNPARSSKTGKAFIGTRSGKKLLGWLEKAGLAEYHLDNVSHDTTPDNKPLLTRKIRDIVISQNFLERIRPYRKVIAVGRQAANAMNIAVFYHKLSTEVLQINHPSGLNRVLNQTGAEDKTIELISRFIKEKR